MSTKMYVYLNIHFVVNINLCLEVLTDALWYLKVILCTFEQAERNRVNLISSNVKVLLNVAEHFNCESCTTGHRFQSLKRLKVTIFKNLIYFT